ncbi:hypothetical protein CVT26_010490 [Gymnopilus dilepis]|uniref:Uncharacterized protein n=1 Tax=Gymnopilus dilepis TaxID=231916 RepID=A0A409Y0H3_9AGAR|nr:hypothetical protein CVT26_010490 [Gymnopilus dilepis]
MSGNIEEGREGKCDRSQSWTTVKYRLGQGARESRIESKVTVSMKSFERRSCQFHLDFSSSVSHHAEDLDGMY